jgi:hypothetical protein
MARVAVSEEVWSEFRLAIGTRSIADALGDLVEREVARSRSRRLRESELKPRELLEALDRAHQQQDDLAALVARLETLRRHA